MMRLLAALVFFTRLPFWRITEVPASCFKNIVAWWPFAGWLTSGISVAVLYAAALVLPVQVAVLAAIISRLLVTGCLHEDGLADFIDGFGGGSGRTNILAIMKDSHIGSYGVIGLVMYFGLLYLSLRSLPIDLAGAAMLAGDPFCKGVAGMTINRLPYARTEQEAKNRTVYSRMDGKEYAGCCVCALLPLLWLPSGKYVLAAAAPVAVWFLLTSFMERKIQGYTGDCCGAAFLLCELSFYIGINILYK